MLKNKLLRWIRFPEYFLETFGKYLSGRGIEAPHKNGELKLIESIVNKHNKNEDLCVLDVGANLGLHTKKFLEVAGSLSNLKILAIEPNPPTLSELKKSISDSRVLFLDCAVANDEGSAEFFIDATNELSGSNSLYNHYYLNGETHTVSLKTIDNIFIENSLDHVHFLKIDTEGAELDALLGARNSMRNHLIDYIQIEYNQTWIKSGASIEQVMEICHDMNYLLYRITPRGLISMPVYNYLLDDFYFQNLLLISASSDAPMKILKTALPPEITDTI
jgi:FkbM family methyltransferase